MKEEPKPHLVPIGDRLRKARKAVDVSQTAAAKLVGVTPQAWSQWELGKRPFDFEAAIIFCDRYNVTLDWLYRGQPAGLPLDIAAKVLPAARIFAFPPSDRVPATGTKA